MRQFHPRRTRIQQLELRVIDGLYSARRQKLFKRVHSHEGGFTSTGADVITAVCVSDTHNCQVENVPNGDLLVHAGDLTSKGTVSELHNQLNWLNSLPHEHKVIIGGNHDLCLDRAFLDKQQEQAKGGGKSLPGRDLLGSESLDWGNLTYLQDQAVTLHFANKRSSNGNSSRILKIFGSPYTPRFGNFAFQYDPKHDRWAGKIPNNTDIVLVHGPPLCHLDTNPFGASVRCVYLRQELYRTRPKMVVFGHIHDGNGQEIVQWDHLQAVWERTLVAEGSSARDKVNCLKSGIAANFKSIDDTGSTHLANVAVTSDASKESFYEPTVVLL